MAGSPLFDSGIRNWTPDQLSDLRGKTYLITGGNSGIGLEAARHLGRVGADVILACRSLEKGDAAQRELARDVSGKVELLQLDLSDLSSVRRASEEVHQRWEKVDGLINNAGIMQTPQSTTKDGFELQMGTNHLGHFLWAGLMLDLVEAAEGRIVVVSSIAHKMTQLNLGDLMTDQDYTPSKAYFQSKLANLVFAFELDRRLKLAGSKAIALACHPGYSSTNLQSTGPQGWLNWLYKISNPLIGQSSVKGAIPTVLAAAGSEAKRSAYYGPTGWGDARGPVGDARVAKGARNQDEWCALWEKSEELVGFNWQIPAAIPA